MDNNSEFNAINLAFRQISKLTFVNRLVYTSRLNRTSRRGRSQDNDAGGVLGEGL